MSATKSLEAKDVIISNDHSIDHEGTRRFYFVLAKHAEREVRLHQKNSVSSGVLMFSLARAESRFLSRESDVDNWTVPSLTTIVSFISDTMDYVRTNYKRFINKLPPQGHFRLVDDSMPWWNKESDNNVVTALNVNDVLFEDGNLAFGGRFKTLLDLNREWYHSTRNEIEGSVVVDFVINRVVLLGGRFLELNSGGDDSWSPVEIGKVATFVNACLDDASMFCASAADAHKTESQSRQVVKDPSASMYPSPKKAVEGTKEDQDDAMTPTGASNKMPGVTATRPLKKRKVHQDSNEGLQRPSFIFGRSVSVDSDETGKWSQPLLIIPGSHHSFTSTSLDDISMPDTRKNPVRSEPEELEALGQLVSNPGKADVILFGHFHSHFGNKRLYSIILALANYYWQLGSSEEQNRVVLDIIEHISNVPGRFVARSHRGWCEVKEHIVQKYIKRGFHYLKTSNVKPTNEGPSTPARLDSTRLPTAQSGHDTGTHQMAASRLTALAHAYSSTPEVVDLGAPESFFVRASRTSQWPPNYSVMQHPGILPPRDAQPWQVGSPLPSATLSNLANTDVAALQGYSIVRDNIQGLLLQPTTQHEPVGNTSVEQREDHN